MFVNKKHFRNFEVKFTNHSYLNFSGQILKKVNSIDLGQKKRFFSNFFCRFGFLVKFQLRTELDLIKYSQEKNL